MASTNKTTNYELSQYVGTDKPTYLGDYNSDMLKIDTAIHNVSESAGTQAGEINIIKGNIGTLGNLTTDEKGSLVGAINEVDSNSKNNATNIGTLSNLETENKTSIVNAINEVNSVLQNFNLTQFYNITNADITMTDGTIVGDSSIQYATNSDGSLAKIYGWLTVTGSGIRSPKIEFNTTLRPESEITINGMCFSYPNSSNNICSATSVVISTTGKVTLRIWNANNVNNPTWVMNIIPCLIYVKDFGDIPIQ